MWDENERFVESKARTNRLKCSDCGKKIPIGMNVVFKLNTETERMKDCYCSDCGKDYLYEVTMDMQHPFDMEP